MNLSQASTLLLLSVSGSNAAFAPVGRNSNGWQRRTAPSRVVGAFASRPRAASFSASNRRFYAKAGGDDGDEIDNIVAAAERAVREADDLILEGRKQRADATTPTASGANPLESLFQSAGDAIAQKARQTAADVMAPSDPEANGTTEVDTGEVLTKVLQAEIKKLQTDVKKAGTRASRAEEQVLDLRRSVDRAEAELSKTKRKLTSEEAKWASERKGLMGKLTKQRSADEASAKTARRRQEELQGQIASLKATLAQSEGVLAEEREAAREIRDRLLEAEDQLEFSQDQMNKDRADLDRQLEEEKARLSEVERKIEEEKSGLQAKNERDLERLEEVRAQLVSERVAFEGKVTKLEEQIEAGVRDRQSKAESMGKRYGKIRSEMTELWQSALREKRELEKKIEVDLASRDEAITLLREELDEVKVESNAMKEERERIVKERDDALEERRRVESELSANLYVKELKIVELTNDIAEQISKGDSYRTEISSLRDQLTQELATREELEVQMKSERERFQEELNRLEEQKKRMQTELATKTKKMDDRFNSMRKNMIDLLAKAKTGAKLKEAMLTKDFEEKIGEKKRTIERLEGELLTSWRTNDELQENNIKTTRQKDAALEEIRQLDLKLVKKNVEFSSMKQVVAERDEKITQYESKYRELVKLTFKLTRKRLGNFLRRIKK